MNFREYSRKAQRVWYLEGKMIRDEITTSEEIELERLSKEVKDYADRELKSNSNE